MVGALAVILDASTQEKMDVHHPLLPYIDVMGLEQVLVLLLERSAVLMTLVLVLKTALPCVSHIAAHH